MLNNFDSSTLSNIASKKNSISVYDDILNMCRKASDEGCFHVDYHLHGIRPETFNIVAEKLGADGFKIEGNPPDFTIKFLCSSNEELKSFELFKNALRVNALRESEIIAKKCCEVSANGETDIKLNIVCAYSCNVGLEIRNILTNMYQYNADVLIVDNICELRVSWNSISPSKTDVKYSAFEAIEIYKENMQKRHDVVFEYCLSEAKAGKFSCMLDDKMRSMTSIEQLDNDGFQVKNWVVGWWSDTQKDSRAYELFKIAYEIEKEENINGLISTFMNMAELGLFEHVLHQHGNCSKKEDLEEICDILKNKYKYNVNIIDDEGFLSICVNWHKKYPDAIKNGAYHAYRIAKFNSTFNEDVLKFSNVKNIFNKCIMHGKNDYIFIRFKHIDNSFKEFLFNKNALISLNNGEYRVIWKENRPGEYVFELVKSSEINQEFDNIAKQCVEAAKLGLYYRKVVINDKYDIIVNMLRNKGFHVTLVDNSNANKVYRVRW